MHKHHINQEIFIRLGQHEKVARPRVKSLGCDVTIVHQSCRIADQWIADGFRRDIDQGRGIQSGCLPPVFRNGTLRDPARLAEIAGVR